MKIEDIVKNIEPADSEVLKKARERTACLAMPARAMGELNALSERLCAMRRTLSPTVEKRELFIMAADHGVYEEGVAPYPQEVTMQMMKIMLQGRSAVCVYAKHMNTDVTLVDVGTKVDEDGTGSVHSFYSRKIARGSSNFTKAQAMSTEQAEQSILTGFEIASKHINGKKLDIVAIGEMGIANTTPSSAIASVFTSLEPEKVTGYGSGVDKEGWLRKVNAIKEGIALNKPSAEDPIDALAKVGGFEIGAMAGVILAAAYNKIPVVLDGLISTASALIAHALCPASADYMIAGHESEEQGHKHMLALLGLTPLIRLNMRLGEGTGAVCAIALVEMAAATITEIATFDEAGIS